MRSPPVGAVTPDRPLSGINILVVEDHTDSRDFLDEALTYYGAAVIPVESAKRAMQIVAKVTPTIVIADVAMPHYDGVWLLRELRLHQQTAGRYVPVVALTASVRRPLRADFDAILIKPCPIERLCQVILRLTRGIEENVHQA
jgi:CheY-like chemotaxis protein